MLAARILRILSVNALLLPGLGVSVHAQTTAVAAPLAPPSPGPRLLLKAGLRLTHLVYQPDYQSWQLVLPLSLGVEYRVQPRLSLYAQAETDASSGRIPRGRRGALAALSTPTTDISLGARYYFNQPGPADPQASPEPWGNYVAFESSVGLTQNSTRGRRGRGLSLAASRRLSSPYAAPSMLAPAAACSTTSTPASASKRRLLTPPIPKCHLPGTWPPK